MLKPILPRIPSLRPLRIPACLLALALLSPRPAPAAVFVVKNGVADTSKGSLTYMLNRVSEGDTLTFNMAEQDTLTLAAEITLSKSLSIFGLNAATGNRIYLVGAPRVFRVTSGSFKFTNLSMRGKWASAPRESNGGVLHISGPKTSVVLDSVEVRWGLAYARGGGILNDTSTLVISNSSILNNGFESSTYGNGGGIHNHAGKLRLVNTTLTMNRAQFGGGLYNDEGGTVEMDRCTVSGQSINIGGIAGAYLAGAGIYNAGRMSIANSTISDNTAAVELSTIVNNAYSSGGGLYNKGTLTLSNCTVTGNSCPASTRNSDAVPKSQGGGIFNDDDGVLFLTNSTVAFNSRTGGIEGYDVFALNSIIACNKGYNAYNQVKGRNNNVNDTLPAKVFGDAKAKAGDYGGPTRTIPLTQAGSAVGAGIRSGTTSWDTASTAPYKPVFWSGSEWILVDTQLPVAAGIKVFEAVTDQRGVKRKDPPSIGAFEFDGSVVPVNPVPGTRNEGSIRVSVVGRNVFRIHAKAPGICSVALFDPQGKARARFDYRVDAATGNIELGQGYAPGVYLMTIRNAGSKAAFKVFLE